MTALSFFDEMIEKCEFISEIRCDLGVFVPIVINQFLQQALLITRILDETEYEPRQQR